MGDHIYYVVCLHIICMVALYWLLVLQTELAAKSYLLCNTETLALRVVIVRPGCAAAPGRGQAPTAYLYLLCRCVYSSIVVCTLSTRHVGGVCSQQMHI